MHVYKLPFHFPMSLMNYLPNKKHQLQNQQQPQPTSTLPWVFFYTKKNPTSDFLTVFSPLSLWPLSFLGVVGIGNPWSLRDRFAPGGPKSSDRDHHLHRPNLRKEYAQERVTWWFKPWPFWDGEFTWPFQGVKTWPPTPGIYWNYPHPPTLFFRCYTTLFL